MSLYSGRRLIFAGSLWCYFLLLARVSLAQDSELEILKTQLREMQQQMQKMMERIDQLEQERALQIEAAAQPVQPAVQSIPGALNPTITVFGNFVGRWDSRRVFNEDGDRISNKFNLREVEVDMRAAIDPYADGVLIASLESETPGQFSASVEEGYAVIKKLPFLDEPPLGLKLKVGRFRPLFGKFNVIHTHDLPTTFRSLPTAEFMGEEGLIQNGVSGNFFIPKPWDPDSSLDATIEILNGGDIAISSDARARMSYLAHLRWFRTFQDAHSLELGWSSYFHPAGNKVRSADFHGIDLMYRWKPLRQGEWKSFLLGGEFMFAPRAHPNASEPADVDRAITLRDLQPGRGKPYGLSLLTQWQFNQRTYAGLRWDYTTTLFNPGLKRRSLTPYVSYYFTEFLRARLNYEHRWSDLFTENNRKSMFFELNWVFGSHPPEPFWVNK
ncbi:MAG: hypothetical protein HY695_22705 [Deltaproteobacteria bacterium]|nr:hypothetical protein [Deltaproteobacteria bacterium]